MKGQVCPSASLAVSWNSHSFPYRVLPAIGSTKSLLSNLRSFTSSPTHRFTNGHWVVRYLVLEDQPHTPEVRPPTSHHFLSIADNSSFRADIIVSPLRGGFVQSITLPDVLEKEEDIVDELIPLPLSHWSLSSENH